MAAFVYLCLLLILVLLTLVSTQSIADDGSKHITATVVTLEQAVAIVRKRRLTECVARTICELSCDPEYHGSLGKRVYTLLRHFETVASPQLDYYKLASIRGKTCEKSGDTEKCSGYYPLCKTPANSLLKLADMITIKT